MKFRTKNCKNIKYLEQESVFKDDKNIFEAIFIQYSTHLQKFVYKMFEIVGRGI